MNQVVERIDDLGQWAWVSLMVVSFVLVWPVGLAVLAFLLWSGRMGCRWHGGGSEQRRDRWERKIARMQERMERWGCAGSRSGRGQLAPTGNRAFDEYREETLKRLEDEAQEFRSYLERLRHAKDKAEFDQFMIDRRNRPAESGSEPTAV